MKTPLEPQMEIFNRLGLRIFSDGKTTEGFYRIFDRQKQKLGNIIRGLKAARLRREIQNIEHHDKEWKGKNPHPNIHSKPNKWRYCINKA